MIQFESNNSIGLVPYFLLIAFRKKIHLLEKGLFPRKLKRAVIFSKRFIFWKTSFLKIWFLSKLWLVYLELFPIDDGGRNGDWRFLPWIYFVFRFSSFDLQSFEKILISMCLTYSSILILQILGFAIAYRFRNMAYGPMV